MLDMQTHQEDINEWTKHNFPDTDLAEQGLGLAEEAGEVCRAILKDKQKIRGTHVDWMVELSKELGDTMIKCFQVAEIAGLDLETCLRMRWGTIKLRDWVIDPEGHGLPNE